MNNSARESVSKVKDCSSIVDRLQVSPPSNRGMHPTADTNAFMYIESHGTAGDAGR